MVAATPRSPFQSPVGLHVSASEHVLVQPGQVKSDMLRSCNELKFSSKRIQMTAQLQKIMAAHEVTRNTFISDVLRVARCVLRISERKTVRSAADTPRLEPNFPNCRKVPIG